MLHLLCFRNTARLQSFASIREACRRAMRPAYFTATSASDRLGPLLCRMFCSCRLLSSAQAVFSAASPALENRASATSHGWFLIRR